MDAEERDRERMDALWEMYAKRERLVLASLAHGVAELVTIMGQLNALVGMETDANLERHVKIKEDLLDVMATVTRAADHFDPPRPPE